jgi:cation/acetate symporter|tara:strand:+ start:134 stop:1882 length:1749 start_codon:yes stop_codon:yes gene_type:complete
MEAQTLTYIFVGLSFALYIGIAIASRAKSTNDFYVAGKGVNPVANGMATAADWMSAASFLSMAGLIAFLGRDGSVYLMGWTGGYVLLALLLAPYLRKYGKYTVPDFIGERYYSNVARVVAVICLIFISFTYIAGQMRGVGIVFSRFLEVEIEMGVIIGMGIVFIYAVLGGMKGITYTQVAQYCVMIFAYLVPAIFLSIMLTGNPIPQLGFGDKLLNSEIYLIDKLDKTIIDLGFSPYTEYSKSLIDIFCITAALMFGTAGLPHVIVRFFTVPNMQAARRSAGYALVFIAILYTTAPAVASFARLNFIDSVQNTSYEDAPDWFKNWENIGLISWMDKNQDGKMQYSSGSPFVESRPIFSDERGNLGQRLLENEANTSSSNEVYLDRDIIVLANPEIANLPIWVIALVAAGGLAAALSTAAGLLLVISSSISHDLMKQTFMPQITEKKELLYARLAAGITILLAGLLGIFPPAFVAQVVAFAFGLAASTLFPVLFMGIFSKKTTKEAAIGGMLTGLVFTFSYIVFFKFISPELNNSDYWFLGISPEGIGVIGMILNFLVMLLVTKSSKSPPESVINLVETIRRP